MLRRLSQGRRKSSSSAPPPSPSPSPSPSSSAPLVSPRATEATARAVEELPEAPVPLISFTDSDDHLVVNDEAVSMLQRIEGPVAVIAMAGLYRTGKSSMLNWLLGRPHGFRVGPTIERCTRGIWLWGQPQAHTNAQGDTIWVLVLDTEGMGGLEASQQYDARIFSLATLLCSKLLYNSQGSVDEKAINGLSFIANLAQHLRIRSAEEEEEEEENDAAQFHSFFPSFMWIVRDFSLELVDEDGDAITSSEYLEQALAEQPRVPANMERNRIRSMMKDFFRERDCCTLVRPVHDEAKLQQVDELAIDELRPEFQAQLAALKERIFGGTALALEPKRLQGKPLNGRMFAGLLQSYVEAINRGGVPVITSAWDGVTASECRKAMHNAQEQFLAELQRMELPLDQEELVAASRDAETRALNEYRKHAMGDSAMKLERELLERIQAEKHALQAKNDAQSKEMCDRLLQVLYSERIQPQLTSLSGDTAGGFGFDDMQQFTTQWSDFRDTYLSRARGSAKLEALVHFSEAKYAEAMRILLSKQEEGFDHKVRVLQSDVARVKEELGSVGGREQIYKEQIEKMQVDSSTVRSEKARLEAETQAQEALIAKLQAQLQDATQTKQHVEVERESVDHKLHRELRRREEVDEELTRIKQEYEALIKEKERREMDVQTLTEECATLRKGQTCGCVIS